MESSSNKSIHRGSVSRFRNQDNHSYINTNITQGNIVNGTKDYGECSRQTVRFQNYAFDSVDNIIKRYKDKTLNKQHCPCSNFNLYRNIGEHELLTHNIELSNTNQYVIPKYTDINKFIKPNNKDDRFNIIDDNVIKCDYNLNEKNEPKVIFNDSGLTSNDKLYADKTTYCRPVLSLYNEQFIYKTMERNSKLKRLVKKLAIARQREQENVSWNNFINELKNRHGIIDEPHQNLGSEPEIEQYFSPDIIDDFYNTRFSSQKSRLCKSLLQDFYRAHGTSQSRCAYRQQKENDRLQSFHINNNPFPYKTDSYCYPTSSHGRLIVLERERRHKTNLNQWHNRYSNDNFGLEKHQMENRYFQRKPVEMPSSKSTLNSLNNKYVANSCLKNSSIQTLNPVFQRLKDNLCKDKATNKLEILSKDELVQTSENNRELKGKKTDIGSNMRSISLINIEQKLETLIDSINSFIDEIKSNMKPKRKIKCASVTCEMNNKETSKIFNLTKKGAVGATSFARSEGFVCGMGHDSSASTFTTSNFYYDTLPKNPHIDDILNEIDEFNSKDLLYQSKPCSVQITFEVPTKDCSTEVTKSLSKHNIGDEIVEEIKAPESIPLQQMTIAVNTDPPSFLSILRISTEALKRLLSYMPNIDYLSYLSLPHFPQSRSVESHFICNICGASFNKPSKLSDHIREHNLGKTRDCCVCRHVLDMYRRHPRLFRCQFCGQSFARAYCCELHQQCCARRLGQPHDVTSSLMLLR